jgi:hypothetical protein
VAAVVLVLAGAFLLRDRKKTTPLIPAEAAHG